MKYNYFDALEALSQCALETVRASCSVDPVISSKLPSEKRTNFNSMLLELENSLFEEFLPPLKRESIAEYAHCLSRLTDAACEHMTAKLSIRSSTAKQSEEEKICIELAKRIHEGTAMLKALKKPGETPDIKEYRELSCRALDAHNAESRAAKRGALCGGREEQILSAGKLRSELSLCFDGLLELMLNNI